MPKFTLTFFLLLTSVYLFAQQPKYVNEFLNIGVGAKGHGMFNAQVATVNDVTAGFWNPSGLANVNAPFQVSAMHAEWFAGIASYDYIGLTKKIGGENNAHLSLNVIRMAIDNIPNTLNLIGPDGSVNYDRIKTFSAADYGFLASYGQKLGNNWNVGGSAKVIRRSLGSFGSAWGFGVDLGAQYKKPRFSIGLMAKDITTTYNSWTFNLTPDEQAVFESTGNEIPTSSTELALPKFILGFAFHSDQSDLSRKIHYLVEANVNLNTDGRASGLISNENFAIEPTIGGEVSYNNLVFLRAGVGNLQRLVNEFNADDRSFSMVPTMGIGLKLKQVQVDYALNNIGSQGSNTGNLYTHIISLTIDFSPKS